MGETPLKVVLTIVGQQYEKNDWQVDFNGPAFDAFWSRISNDLALLGYQPVCVRNPDLTITVRSYTDLLNCVKLSTPSSQGTHCVGHCIGKSEHLDLFEDIEVALRRLLFAPETIPPADEFRKVCHNCGCGC